MTVLPSPGFVFKADRGVDMLGTIWHGIRHTRHWHRSLRHMNCLIEEAEPDVVVNFFEPLTGALKAMGQLPVPVLAAAHQFALLGPGWGAPRQTPVAPLWLRSFIRFVGFGASKLALSFTPPEAGSSTRVTVAPPLLREQVLTLAPRDGDYVLVYVATHGYAESVRSWNAANPEVRLHCFYDRPGAPAEDPVTPTLTFHSLDTGKFLEMMAGCTAVVCTAGFESICEAAFLGKPVLMIPLEGHLEQELNARDGVASGVAVAHPTFDLDALSKLPRTVETGWFREWCLEAESRFVDAVEGAVAGASDGTSGSLRPRPHPCEDGR